MRSEEKARAEAAGFLKTLAARNVKKSAKDYFIYFFTLTLSVCLFYSFNSVSTQFASLGIEDPYNYLSFSSGVLSGFSVLVCAIIGGLIVYANRFLLRRRKKEMGVYLTLGMERRDVNRLLMRETLRVGAASLVFGVGLGVLFAQLLSLTTASLIGLSLDNYRFLFSVKSTVLSTVFFGVLFFFVHRFNVRELKKMTLLDMLYADRKNESISRNQAITALLGVLAVLLLLGGYGAAVFLAGQDAFKALGIGGTLLIAGTVLFFTSALRLAVRLRERNRRFYFRGLNMFTTSQLASRLKTEGRTVAVTSILLFLSLSLTMLGPGIGKYIINGVENAAPYDGTVYYAARVGSPEASADPLAYFMNSGFPIGRFSDRYLSFWTYEAADLTYAFLDPNDRGNVPLTVMGVEDYNRLMEMQGAAPLRLSETEFAVSYAFPQAREALTAFSEAPRPLHIGDAVLTLAGGGLRQAPWKNTNVLSGGEAIIVPQNLAEKLTPQVWYLNFDLAARGAEANAALRMSWLMDAPEGYAMLTAEEALISVTADNLLMTYLGLYLGVTFLITAGAVLALQQLSQSADNTKRFTLLKRLGASRRELRRSLRKQLKFYFGLPLLMALVNAAVVVTAIFRYLQGLPPAAVAAVVGFSLLLVFLVYAVYYLTTYWGSRRILEV